MDARWLIPPLVLLALAGTAGASHDPLTLPLQGGEETVDEAVDWLEDERVTAEGCVHDAYDEDCYVERTKWLVTSLGHAGIDPTTWPSPEASSTGWLLERGDDLRDEALVECEAEATSSGECADKRVFSLAKAILAFQAADHDPRALPLPEGGERDLVAELLDEHAGSEFGRMDQVNDDIWALIALNAVDHEGPEIEDALDRIRQAQNIDGGLGYLYDVSSSVDMTAAAIMAAAPHDASSFLQDARAYLADEQLREGDRRGCWSISTDTSTTANAESTAWALQAIAALAEDPLDWSQDDQAPPECLVTFQAEAGGFRHDEGSTIEFLPTQQALAALPWRPYGTATEPVSPLATTDEATVGQQHTATVPGASLRIGQDAVPTHAWTPADTGERVFHGYTQDPVRPVELVVDVQAQGSSGSSPSGSAGGDEGEPSAVSRPLADLSAPATAERNVTFTVQVEAEPDAHPITSFRLQVPGHEPTAWQPAGTFEVELTTLGPSTLQAWARDAGGNVSEPAETEVQIVDAAPQAEIHGPEVVDRNEPVAFHARAHDPDGTAPNLTWTGPGDQRAHGPEAALVFDDPGPAEVRLEARDQAGNTANASLTVHARNRPPANLSVQPAQLEANASEIVRASAVDPDGDPLAVTWREPGDDEPIAWGAQLHLETGAPGHRELVVEVADPHEGWTRARVNLSVREQPADQQASPLQNVTVQADQPRAEAPSPDAEGPPARMELPGVIEARADESRLLHATAHSPSGPVVNVTVALGGPVPVRGTEDVTAMLPALPAGEYELAARAADQGGWGPWTTATLVVEPAPEATEVDTASEATEHGVPLSALAALLGLAAAAGRARGP